MGGRAFLRGKHLLGLGDTRILGFVYAIGISAVWMIPGVWVAYAVVWLYFGRQLRQESKDHQQVTLTDFLLHDASW